MKGTFIGLLINNPAIPFFSLCVCAPCALTDWHCDSTRFTWRWEPTYNIDIMVIWWNAQPGRWFLGLKIGHLVFHHLWRKKIRSHVLHIFGPHRNPVAASDVNFQLTIVNTLLDRLGGTEIVHESGWMMVIKWELSPWWASLVSELSYFFQMKGWKCRGW